jgi:hypothetical protein
VRGAVEPVLISAAERGVGEILGLWAEDTDLLIGMGAKR